MLADELDYALGVDTHRDEHVVAVVTAPAGAVIAGSAAPANVRGYRELLRLAERHAPGRRAWAIEGTESYGAGLVRFLAGRGELVLELSRSPRGERRLRGKDDGLDAVRTARAALASETLSLPRSGERREALRLLLVARRSAVDVRREALSQLRAVIVTSPDKLRSELRGLPVGQLLDRCSRLRRTGTVDELANGSCSAASPAASRPQHSRPPSSKARSSPTSTRSHPSCSTNPVSARSLPLK